VFNGVVCVVTGNNSVYSTDAASGTASPWRLLPHDFPHRSTVPRYFYAWQAAGLWETINIL
jgi:hypothetical protein